MYRAGWGVPQEDDLAVSFYRQAVSFFRQDCDGGTAGGCYYLGLLYLDGLGVERDVRRAILLFEKACAGKIDESCETLDNMRGLGGGVSRDMKEAGELRR